MPKIYLSPSDQDGNSYAYGNTNEDAQCERIADATAVALKRCGFDVKNNKTAEMEDRVAESNAWGADMHIAIHTNAFNHEVGGTRVYYYSDNGYGNVAAKAVYDELKGVSPGDSDNIRSYPQLYELRATNATSVYVEAEFHDGPYAKWIIEHPVDIAEAICRGVCKYYKMPYKAASKPTPAPSGEMYRVRKTWADVASQIGAYKELANAKAACKVGYKVFNSKGVVVYEPTSAPAFKPYNAQVTANEGLNVRKGAGTNYGVAYALTCGTVVTVTKEDHGWGQIKDGWISLEYVKKVNTMPSYKVKVVPSIGLNYRSGPSTGYSVQGAYTCGTVLTIVQEQNGWGKTSDNTWVSLEYVKKI